jgi:hypothetical protein
MTDRKLETDEFPHEIKTIGLIVPAELIQKMKTKFVLMGPP